ncbi:hypothetical protein [Micromonospora sp. WMMD980]|uniref:hypothetical protein n=1 Tax=Micromonospora sp. WMMD980 TaxID=3016088 RepID=UPI0024169065|nr:hypothetical protein [Micromonospora sp. WMMD980]MDG4800996.1 hypothetical protein [Micromonospora sp. WMMD980]
MTQRYVIHLPIVAADLPAAQRLARVVGRWMLVLPRAEPGGTTVSVEDDQNVRHWVFCDAPMANGRRCLLGTDHDGPCSRRLLGARRSER